jgi:peptide-methionine (S)-S-oxide reductase
MENNIKIAVFGGGCFWCTEAVFKMLNGVISVSPGYSGGTKVNPTYMEVVGGGTGHAEVTKVEYDNTKIAFSDLLNVFFASHDPTTLNRQGNDVGTQYRSVIFYTDMEQKKEAEAKIKEINDSTAEGDTVVTEVIPLEKFYPAEDYHKNYFANNSEQMYCQLVINPKLKKVQDQFEKLLKR